jgi:peptidoglycan hydrolase-like protein with peptidoglycan-binding domain
VRIGPVLLAAGVLAAVACTGGDTPDRSTVITTPTTTTTRPDATEPVTTEPITTEPITTLPPTTTAEPGDVAALPSTWLRFGADGLFLVDADGEQRLVDEPVGWAASDGSGGVLLTIWDPDRFGPTWWLPGGAAEPVLASEWDEPLIAARLDGRPAAIDGWPSPGCDEAAADHMSARDLITGETTTLQCDVGGPDSGRAPDSFGGGMFVGVEWDAVHPSGRSTAIRLVFRDGNGEVVELATNPFADDCSPCELAVALSPDGSRIAVIHRADAAPSWPDEHEAWLTTTSAIDAELLVVDLATGDVIHHEVLPAGTRPATGSWFDGRHVALAPDAFGFPWLAPGDSGEGVRTLQRLLVQHGADIDVDGTFGPGTQAAVEAFHATRFGSERATVGPDTWAELGIASIVLDITTGGATEVPGRITLDVIVDDVPAPGVPTGRDAIDELAILRADGLGPFAIGDDAGDVQAWLVERLGEPDASVVELGEGGWPMPSCAERRFAYWATAGLTVGFTDLGDDESGTASDCDDAPHLAGWYVVTEGPPWFAPDHGEAPASPIELRVTTRDAIGLGTAVGDLRAADPGVALGEWDVDGYVPAVFRTSTGMQGRVAWDSSADVQQALDELGVELAEFQSSHGIDEDGAGPQTLEALAVSVPDGAPIVYLWAGDWDWGF